MGTCAWCGEPSASYMTHVCTGCECTIHEARDPGEPQLGSWVEIEPNPWCPIHGD